MQKTDVERKQYSTPAVSVIGTLSEETMTGEWFKKRAGPGDQFFMTDPPNCWDGRFFNNCQETSA